MNTYMYNPEFGLIWIEVLMLFAFLPLILVMYIFEQDNSIKEAFEWCFM